MKILLVEDDDRIAAPIKEELEHNQFRVSVALDGLEGLNLGRHEHYDVILLDVMLPTLDGMHVCQTLRKEGCQSAIIMMTALDTTTSKIKGLDSGADDYLVKPFDVDELLARIRAVLRRNAESREPLLSWDDVVLDPSTCEVKYDGTTIDLTPTEFRLLSHFLRHPNRIFSKDELLERLWLPEDVPTDAIVKAHVKGLRKNFELAGAPKDIIETVYGFGYRLRQHV